MNTKLFGRILAALLLLELAAARMVLLHETIIKANGDRIIRNWTTTESEETERNSYGVVDNFIRTASLLERDFGQNKNNPRYTQSNENHIESWTETKQQPTESSKALIKPNGVYVTHSYHAEPMSVVSVASDSRPQIIFAGNWQEIFRGWALKENTPQKKWQNEAKTQNLFTMSKVANSEVEKPAQDTDNNDVSLDAFLSKILGREITTPTTTRGPSTTQLKYTDSTEGFPSTEDDYHLPEINTNDNQTPADASLDEFLSNKFKVNNKSSKERKTVTNVWPFTAQRRSIIENGDYFQTSQKSSKPEDDWLQSNSANMISIENIR